MNEKTGLAFQSALLVFQIVVMLTIVAAPALPIHLLCTGVNGFFFAQSAQRVIKGKQPKALPTPQKTVFDCKQYEANSLEMKMVEAGILDMDEVTLCEDDKCPRCGPEKYRRERYGRKRHTTSCSCPVCYEKELRMLKPYYCVECGMSDYKLHTHSYRMETTLEFNARVVDRRIFAQLVV